VLSVTKHDVRLCVKERLERETAERLIIKVSIGVAV
jgi:hypothetical protein